MPSRRSGSPSAREAVARILLGREPGQRIPPVQDLQRQIGVGTGTVVKAMRQLEDADAVALESRGRLGTTVVSRHVGRLWEFAALGNLHIVMPPPGPIEQHAVATVLQDVMSRQSIPMVIDFASGSRQRLEMVFHEQAHAATTSLAAFRHHSRSLGGLLSLDLGAGSFYAPDSLVVIERPDRPAARRRRPRVGIDRSSYDHENLTLAEFADVEGEFVDCAFHRAPAAVLAGEVDLVVWHELPTVIPPRLAGLTLRPVKADTIESTTAISHAALATRALDAPTNAALRSVQTAAVAAKRRALASQSATNGDASTLWPR